MTDTLLLTEVIKLLRNKGFSVEIDAPSDPMGETFLDISKDGTSVQASYRMGVGIGVFLADPSFGDRPDEIYVSSSAAASRIEQQFQVQT